MPTRGIRPAAQQERTAMQAVIPPLRLKVAVVGTGISGMAAAWLLAQRHEVTVYERADRVGGHSNTVPAGVGADAVPVDTGFIVYNERTYPNLTALFAHLDVPTAASSMSFSVSVDDGGFEYAGGCGLGGLLAQKRNLGRPRYWTMLRDLARFYRRAAADLPGLEASGASLRAYLDAEGYGQGFREDHLLPMAGAIWSASAEAILDFPAASFIRFFANHGLLAFRDRPHWRTVIGGSRAYVERLTARYADRIRVGAGVAAIAREAGRVRVRDTRGRTETYDHVVIATHADEALQLLADPSGEEQRLLGAFRYSRNVAVLHADPALMPRRRAAWASWNHIGRGETATVTYWMNRLQPLPTERQLFVTLNPPVMPRAAFRFETYEHPIFDAAAGHAQRHLWSLQGQRNTWYCGAHFGAGFHEDGLQAGLAVGEALGGVRRPWRVPDESGRIFVSPPTPAIAERIAA
jgi:predicted NAD/FAD-binding protein